MCHCFPGWYGADCAVGPGHPAMATGRRYCVCAAPCRRSRAARAHPTVHGAHPHPCHVDRHNCSGRGVCMLNFCHCVPGTWGIDCSSGAPDPRVTADTVATYRPAVGEKGSWPQHMLSVGAPVLPSPSRKLRIYVYDLPPKFNIWLAAHFRRPGRWDQSYLYSLDAKVHRWLLRSEYLTRDPTDANYFLMPAYLSLCFYDLEFGLYWLVNRAHHFLNEMVHYVRTTWPYWNRTKGSDHVLIMTNDKGACFIRGSVPMLRRSMLVTQWGWKRPHIHLPELDVVVPPMLKVRLTWE